MSVAAWVIALADAQERSPLDHETAVQLARDFLASNDERERDRLRVRLDQFAGDIDDVIRTLRVRTHPNIKPGYYPELKFADVRRRAKYPRDLLYFVVPPEYEAAKPSGLIVFLHGGGLEHRRTSHRGSMIDATIRSRNRIDITTLHVARCTVWLHPKMVDVTQPVTIYVDGEKRFSARVKPSLATALDSYARRRDWGLIYPIKISLP